MWSYGHGPPSIAQPGRRRPESVGGPCFLRDFLPYDFRRIFQRANGGLLVLFQNQEEAVHVPGSIVDGLGDYIPTRYTVAHTSISLGAILAFPGVACRCLLASS